MGVKTAYAGDYLNENSAAEKIAFEVALSRRDPNGQPAEEPLRFGARSRECSFNDDGLIAHLSRYGVPGAMKHRERDESTIERMAERRRWIVTRLSHLGNCIVAGSPITVKQLCCPRELLQIGYTDLSVVVGGRR
jgi:hypothetical protein